MTTGGFIARVVAVLIALVLVGGLLFGGVSACKSYNRSQALKDARNRVTIARIKANNTIQLTDIEVKRFEQQKKIEKLKAQVRVIHSIGIRKSQDEIAKTLTPLYVAFEQTQALQAIAVSGKNNSIVYIPTNPFTGLPIVPGLAPTASGGGTK